MNEIQNPQDYTPFYMSLDQARGYWHDINNSQISDVIKLTWQADEKMCDFWRDPSWSKHFVPSDLFFAETIPMMDCEIEVDETSKYYPERDRYGTISSYRVTIFTNYQERIKNAHSDFGALVGAVTFKILNSNTFLILPICVIKGDWRIPATRLIALYDPQRNKCIDGNKFFTMEDIASFYIEYLETWYGIQISLLHPSIKEVFSNPAKELVFDYNRINKKKHRKRITRYVKKHVVNEGMISKAINPASSKTIHRKTLAWYVIGHWRHYKNGNQVFIKGYWKGALRHLKKNLDETRERLVDPLKEAAS